jgi:hypothetical protein
MSDARSAQNEGRSGIDGLGRTACMMNTAGELLADYWEAFSDTLLHPTQGLKVAEAVTGVADEDQLGSRNVLRRDQFSWKLWIFVFISVYLGTILNLAVPSRKYSGEDLAKALAMVVFWQVFTAMHDIGYRLCRVKGGHEKTLWVSLQVFWTLYVVASFVNLVGGMLTLVPAISSFLVKSGRLGDSLANNPIYLFFFAQFGLFNIYLPLATKNVHGLRWWQCLLAILFLSLFWVWFGFMFCAARPMCHFGR